MLHYRIVQVEPDRYRLQRRRLIIFWATRPFLFTSTKDARARVAHERDLDARRRAAAHFKHRVVEEL